MPCSAGAEHCCWVAGEVCTYLRENSGGRRWSCALMEELGSWSAVHADPRYRPLGEVFSARGLPDCGDFPGRGRTCATCGVAGG
jgi:hypothetical protein